MNKYGITQERLHELFYYDDEKGGLYRKIKVAGQGVGTRFGCGSNGVRKGRIDSKMMYENILVWVYHHGDVPEDYVVMHKNDDQSDNRIENLEAVTISVHRYLKTTKPDKRSVYRNVAFHNGTKKWFAIIKFEKQMWFGQLRESEEEAALDADKKAVEFYGKYAMLNIER